MIRWPKVLIASLLVIAFGVAVLLANGSERSEGVADELVEATSALPENEGKLVIVSGTPQLADGGVLTDEEANLQVENAVYYSRNPLQKVYVKKSRKVIVDYGEDKKSDLDDTTRTEYYVAEQWINASHDRDEVVYVTTRYENPAPVDLDAYHAVSDVLVGGFRVSPADLSEYIETKRDTFTREELAAACGQYITRSELDLRAVTDADGCGVLLAGTGNDIGDVLVVISYETFVSAEPVTLVGRERGDRLVFEEDDVVTEAEQIQAGTISKDEFLESITSEDASSRVIGMVACALGLVLAVLSLDLRRS